MKSDAIEQDRFIKRLRGFAVDEDEAWRKIISRQFASDPARSFGELIANYIDSYPAYTAFEKRPAAITSSTRTLSITDWGEGMPLERLRLLLTLGGSDKRGDDTKIGRFGIGFFSVFNPVLGVRRVTVTTRCEGHSVELELLAEPGERPRVSAKVLSGKLDFSTRVAAEFSEESAVRACLRRARECLEYYPCPVTMNGMQYDSVWTSARNTTADTFETGKVRGFLDESGRATVLSKYQHVITFSLRSFITGNDDESRDLRDFRRHLFPFIDRVGTVVNCDDLRLTISRDSYYLDTANERMVDAVRNTSLKRLLRELIDPTLDPVRRTGLVLANQYVLSRVLADCLKRRRSRKEPTLDSVCNELLNARIFRINGRRDSVSLADLERMRTLGQPLFFSPDNSNLRWLGGAFKHDFIVLPPACETGHGAPDFYDTLFGDLFGDVVNLATIRNKRERVAELVERGIVPRDALGEQVKLLSTLEIDARERALLDEINTILEHEPVKEAVKKNLAMRVRRAVAAYFRVDDNEIAVSTALFDSAGDVVERSPRIPIAREVTLGLRLDHPLVRALIDSNDPHRAYYALTLVSHELATCQELLVPDTTAFYMVKGALAGDMRRGLVKQLLAAGR